MTVAEQSSSIAAIDLGSNSFHMLVARLEHGEVRVLDRLGEKVQLGAGLDSRGNLDEASQQRALECLGRFRQRIRDFDASSVHIVGTNALRAAKNRKAFLAKAKAVMGFPIEIISGHEEARLIYLGVSHTLADDEGRRLVIDIGGGSTELIIGERFEPCLLESLHMGCVSYREKFFKDGKITDKRFKKAITQASQELLNIKQSYRQQGWTSCVGSSGSIKSIMQAMVKLGYEDECITLERLYQLKSHLVGLEHIDCIDSLEIKKERMSIFPAGLAILLACFEVLKIEEMHYTQGALREGLLYDIVGRIRHEDVRERSIRALQQRYGVDREHAARVRETALYGLQQIAQDWQLQNKDDVLMLSWASEVFEIGLAVSHSQYHKHGAYLLKHSDLPGFTRLIQTQLAAIVRLHRRKFCEELLAEFDAGEAQRLQRLTIIFRLAVILNAARKSAEVGFKLMVGERKIKLSMGEGWLQKHPLTLANLKDEKKALAKQGYELKLE